MSEHGEHPADLTPWLRTVEVPDDRMVTFTAGPLSLSVARRPGEWRLAWLSDVESARRPASMTEPARIGEPPEGFTVHRFLTRGTGGALRLRPRLADRPVVTRPELPLRIPGSEEVRFFVSTPIWVRVELTDPERVLTEIPSLRPSDTWFGQDTRRGTVAYAIQTAARLSLANLPPSSFRAITPVTVRNELDTVLELERVSVPVPNMSLFVDPQGFLWTDSLVAERDSTVEPARVQLDGKPPREAAGGRRVAEPRLKDGRNVISRALHVLAG